MDIKPTPHYKKVASPTPPVQAFRSKNGKTRTNYVDGYVSWVKKPTTVGVTLRRSEPDSSSQQKTQPAEVSRIIPGAYSADADEGAVHAVSPNIKVIDFFSADVPDQSIKSKLWSRKWSSYAVNGFASLLVVGGLAALALTLHTNHSVTQRVRALAEPTKQPATNSAPSGTPIADVPTEDKPAEGAVAQYSVAPNSPKYLHIAKLGGYKSRVLRLGLTDEGAVAVPKSVWDVGWYDGSASPVDAAGSTLLVGHVAGPTTGGIFYNLHKLENNDTIDITMGDNSEKHYTVVSQEEVLASSIDINDYLVSPHTDKLGLTLMTCSGDFDARTNTYNKRIIVRAVMQD